MTLTYQIITDTGIKFLNINHAITTRQAIHSVILLTQDIKIFKQRFLIRHLTNSPSFHPFYEVLPVQNCKTNPRCLHSTLITVPGDFTRLIALRSGTNSQIVHQESLTDLSDGLRSLKARIKQLVNDTYV